MVTTMEADATGEIEVVARAEVVAEIRASFRLAWPLILGYVGHNLLGVVDTAMVGRLGSNELAGTSIGNGIFITLSLVAMGLVTGLDPIVSQAVGAGEGRRADAALRSGLRLGALVSIPAVALILAAPLALPLVGVDESIAVFTRQFLHARAAGAVPFIFAMALRSYLQARGVTKPMMWGSIVANLLNVALNPMLIFGFAPLGVPALGVTGSGLASTVATLGQLVVLFGFFRAQPALPGEGDAVVPLGRIFSIGLPIALTLLAEVGAFTVAGVLAGRIGADAASGHQVAIQLASLTFVIAMAISNAASSRVGQAVGRGDARGAMLASWVNLGVTVLYMSGTSLMFLLFAPNLARVLSNQPEVIAVAVPLIHIAAAFQLFDGVQVVSAGALRGLGDTKTIQYANVVGYYVLGLPFGAALAFGSSFRERGLWWGLSSGLATVAIVGVMRLRGLLGKPVQRLA